MMDLSVVFLALGTGYLGAFLGTAVGERYLRDLSWILEGNPPVIPMILEGRRDDLRTMSRLFLFWAVVCLAGAVCIEVGL
jgi:hypothetical protein